MKQDSIIFGSDNLGAYILVNKRDQVTNLFVKAVYLSLWKVLLIYSLEMILFVVFILAITIYISAMTNKKSKT